MDEGCTCSAPNARPPCGWCENGGDEADLDAQGTMALEVLRALYPPKAIARITGKQRKMLNAALQIAAEEGCDTTNATADRDSRGHFRVHIISPNGQPITLTVACTPKDDGNESRAVRRRLRKTLDRIRQEDSAP